VTLSRRLRSGVRTIVGEVQARRVARAGSPIIGFAHLVGDPRADGPRASLAVDSLLREIAWLRGLGYSFVPLEAILAYLVEGSPPSRAFHLVFDDGFRPVYTEAYPPLRAAGIPFSVALVEESFRGRGLLWPDELALRIRANRGRLPEINALAPDLVEVEGVSAAGTPQYRRNRLKKVQNGDRLEFMERLRGLCPELDRREAEHLEALRPAEAAELRRNGVELLSHTRSHPILSRVEGHDALAREVEPWDTSLLRSDVLVYPNGRPEDVDDRVFSAMRRAGVEFGLTTIRGLVRREGNPFLLPRISAAGRLADLRGEFALLSRRL